MKFQFNTFNNALLVINQNISLLLKQLNNTLVYFFGGLGPIN